MKKIEGCLHCNRCKAKCPYGLDTPALLARNYEDYKRVLAGEVKVYEAKSSCPFDRSFVIAVCKNLFVADKREIKIKFPLRCTRRLFQIIRRLGFSKIFPL